MARLMLAVLFGALLLVGGLACARGGHADAEVLAIAMNEDAEARPRLSFYAGVPGRDSFPLSPGTYDIIVVDAAGALSTVRWTLASGEDADASMLAAWELPQPSEEAGRLNRDAMRNLFLFFARFDEAQAQLEGIVTEGRTKPLPTSPDDLTAVQVMGEEGPQGRVSGLRDWEAEIVPSGRLLELALAAVEGELPPSWDDLSGPFADARTLVREWRDGDAAERRAFVTVVGEMSAEQRAELHKHVVEVFEDVVPKSADDFYRRVETGELDSEMWTIANYCYDDRLGNDGPVYRRIARSQGLEPGRSYYERWLRQEPTTWGFQWSVSEEAAEQAHLPAEVLRVSSEPADTLGLEVGPE